MIYRSNVLYSHHVNNVDLPCDVMSPPRFVVERDGSTELSYPSLFTSLYEISKFRSLAENT